MKNSTIFVNYVFAMLAMVILVACESGGEGLEKPNPGPGPDPTPDPTYTYKMLSDGLTDSTYFTNVSSLFTKGQIAIQHQKVVKGSGDQAGEVKTSIFSYQSSAKLAIQGDGVKVASKALEVGGFSVSETTKGDPKLQGDTCYRYDTKKTFSLAIKTLSGQDAVVSGEFLSQKYELFFEGDRNNRIAEVPSRDVINVEYVKYTLDSVKVTPDKQWDKGYYSVYAKVTSKATFYAVKRYDEWIQLPNTLYNNLMPQTETLKVVGMFLVPAEEEDPIETGDTYEDDNLVKKDNNYYTSSNNKYKNYDKGPKVLEKHNQVDINIFASLDSDPSIIDLGKASISSVGSPTIVKKLGTKTNRTIGEFYIETQPISWVITWTYSTGSVSRTLSTIEEYPYIVVGSKKIKMLSSNWNVNLVNPNMGEAVGYTYNGRKGNLHTGEAGLDADYYGEIRQFLAKVRFFVETKSTEPEPNPDPAVEKVISFTKGHTTQPTNIDGWIKFVISRTYNGQTATRDSISSDGFPFNFEAAANKNFKKVLSGFTLASSSVAKSTSTMGSKTKHTVDLIGVFSFGDRTTTTLTFPGFYTTGYVTMLGKNYDYEVPELIIDKNFVVEQVGSETSVEEAGKTYKRSTYKISATATIGEKTITRSTTVTIDVEISPAVEEVTSFTKGHTIQPTNVDGWIKFVISKTYDGQTTTREANSTDLFGYNFQAAANKNFKKSQAGLTFISSSISESSSTSGTKTKHTRDLTGVFSFGDASTTTLTFPGFYTTGYVTMLGKNYDYEVPELVVDRNFVVEQVGSETSVEEAGKAYKRSTYKVTATATIGSERITRSTTVTVDVEVIQRVNPDKGKFLYYYEAYTVSLDNQLHVSRVVGWEKVIDIIVNDAYQGQVANPNPDNVYQSVACKRDGASWNWLTPANVIVSGDLWIYASGDYKPSYNWKKNASLQGVTFKEGDWNRTNSSNYSKTIDEDGYTVINLYANGRLIHTSK